MLSRNVGKSLFVILLAAGCVSFSFAQGPAKIGVVNSQEVLQKSAEGKKVMSQLESKGNENQDRLGKLDEEIRKLENKVNTQRLTLTQEALMNLNSDIDRKKTERNRFVEDARREMAELQGRMFRRIQDELLPIIQKIGEDSNIDVIFDLGNSGIIHFSSVIDLTDEVIKQYDASKASK
jgi:outer membrane protein